MSPGSRRALIALTLSYWFSICLGFWGLPALIPSLLLAYPVYRCGLEWRAIRVWMLGALISLILVCIAQAASLPLGLALGFIAFTFFFSAGSFHLAILLRNRQAALLLAPALLPFPLAFALGLTLQGFGLVLLCLSGPRRPLEKTEATEVERFPEVG